MAEEMMRDFSASNAALRACCPVAIFSAETSSWFSMSIRSRLIRLPLSFQTEGEVCQQAHIWSDHHCCRLQCTDGEKHQKHMYVSRHLHMYVFTLGRVHTYWASDSTELPKRVNRSTPNPCRFPLLQYPV
jgi:hypothetical protein